jgi:hypothetical protein
MWVWILREARRPWKRRPNCFTDCLAVQGFEAVGDNRPPGLVRGCRALRRPIRSFLSSLPVNGQVWTTSMSSAFQASVSP